MVPIIAAEGDGAANHQAEILSIPEMADADADRRVGRGPRLFEADLRLGDVTLRGQNRQVDLGGGPSHLASGAGVLEVGRIEGEIQCAGPEAPQSGPGEAGLNLGLIEIDLGLREFGLGAGAGEQGVAGHVDPTLHLFLETLGQGEALPRDLKLSLGGQRFGPGALYLLKTVQSPDRGFCLHDGGFAARQRHTRGSIAAAFEPLLIGQGRFRPVDDVASAQRGQVLDHQAHCRIGADVGLTHRGFAGAIAGFQTGAGRIRDGGATQRFVQRE
nr:hypothetical protein [Brevundimonas sp. AJA228-03]